MHTRYPSLWVTGWGAFVVIFMCVGVVVLSATGVILLFIAAAVTAGLVSFVFHEREGVEPIAKTDLVRVIATHAGAGGVVAVAFTALGAVAGGLAWLPLVLAGATSPWTVELVGRHLRREGGTATRRDVPGPLVEPGPPQVLTFVLPTAAGPLSDRELLRAWRDSSDALRAAAHSAPAQGRVVTLRQAYLQELERRNPAAISAWVAAGPRLDGGLG